MAKAYNHHQLTYQTCYTNNSFLPLLCRSSSSLADVKLRPDLKNQSNVHDPSSPKVSCIGQIKRTTTSRRSSTTLPPSSSSATKTNGNQLITYTKLKRWFSLKNISPATTAAVSMVYGSRRAAAAAGGTVGGSFRNGINRSTSSRWSSKITSDDDDDNGVSNRVNISELDPPLPVVAKKLSAAVAVPSEMSLWRRRRSGGEALTTLTIQHHQIHLPNQPAATV